MFQKNFVFHDLAQALKHIESLALLCKHSQCHDALLNIVVAGLSGKECEILLRALDQELAQVKRIGVSAYNMIDEDPSQVFIVFNLLLSKDASFSTLTFPCQPGEELEAAEACRRALDGIEQIRGIEIFPANPRLHVTRFLQEISRGREDVPIFGTMAKVSQIGSNGADDDCFSLGQDIVKSGFVLAVFSGKDLHAYADYVLGWKPIGREMPVRLAAQSPLGESAVELIDGRPAGEIYQKYLGIDWHDNIIENVWAFPLMVRRNNVNLCYIPISSNEENLHFSGSIYEGESIRFSYCTREEILDASFNGSERMRIFAPDAVMMAMCGNRVGFLGAEAHLEWDFYRKNHPDLVFFYGYSEIYYHNGKGGVLNSACVAVGFKEGEDKAHVDRKYSLIPKAQFTPKGKVPFSYLVSHFFHEMTNELMHFQKHLEQEVARKTQENASLSLHIVQTMAQTIDAKDTYTNGHSSRVAHYAREIARRAGYSPAQQEEIYMIGLLHDVGKIGVPDEIINKPGRLTDEEFAIIKTHPSVGAKILSKIQEMPKLVTGAHFHHERYDGRGYPKGLKGMDIPEEARIIAVADAYDAMTSNRSYRNVLAQEIVRAEIAKGQGAQFDPQFARIMLTMIDEDREYAMKEEKKSQA
ncbi:MAG: HD domain-containing protein [Desulfovibrio sp.]|nr:HD domain-containing protein [Desulfovibrio sp.]